MADLIDVNIDTKNLSTESFSSSENGYITNVFLVENGTFILVEEVLDSKSGMTFFDAITLRRIPTQERFEIYDGKVISEKIGNYNLVSKIKVDLETGFENIHEEVLFDNNVIYYNDRCRYNKRGFESLWKRFKRASQTKVNMEAALKEQLSTFKKLRFNEKVRYLRSQFRYFYKARWELGVASEELLLSEYEFRQLDEDKEFRAVLFKVLTLECLNTERSAKEMYKNIIDEYTT